MGYRANKLYKRLVVILLILSDNVGNKIASFFPLFQHHHYASLPLVQLYLSYHKNRNRPRPKHQHSAYGCVTDYINTIINWLEPS